MVGATLAVALPLFNGGDVVEVPGGLLCMYSPAGEHPKEMGAQPWNPMLVASGLGDPTA